MTASWYADVGCEMLDVGCGNGSPEVRHIELRSLLVIIAVTNLEGQGIFVSRTW